MVSPCILDTDTNQQAAFGDAAAHCSDLVSVLSTSSQFCETPPGGQTLSERIHNTTITQHSRNAQQPLPSRVGCACVGYAETPRVALARFGWHRSAALFAVCKSPACICVRAGAAYTQGSSCYASLVEQR